MARPRKNRKVCMLPTNTIFGPKGRCTNKEFITMLVDEYEAIRLIDYEGLTQEECGEKMEIARTTVQQIYNSARKKISVALVEGKFISISGGNYELCEDEDTHCGYSHCCRNGNRNGNVNRNNSNSTYNRKD